MAQRIITFNDTLVSTDKLVVTSFAFGEAVLDAYEGGAHAQVARDTDTLMALSVHLMEEVKAHVDPQVLISHAEAMIADAKARLPQPEAKPKPQGYMALSPLAQKLVQHMRRAGSISHREAMNDYGVTGGSLSRRIVDIEEAGFEIVRTRKTHPITGRPYTRYSLNEA
jgi:hypothetical protein